MSAPPAPRPTWPGLRGHAASAEHALRSGQSRALRLFRAAAREVPAYRDFLAEHGVDPLAIRGARGFRTVPPTTRDNYVSHYGIEARSWSGSLQGMTMISTSSGTTGVPELWPRAPRHEMDGARTHARLFASVFGADRRPTLLVIGFAMGNWIAGTFTLAAGSILARHGWPIVTMTPGYSIEGVLDCLRQASPHFEQTIVAGHVPFLKEVIDEGCRAGIDWARLAPRFLGTGQAVSEAWRSHLAERMGAADPTRLFVNLYGSADASLMGFELPSLVALRRELIESGRATEAFGCSRMPGLYAFDPSSTLLEEMGGEILVTKDAGCPLIRYDIHDEGGMLAPRLQAQDRASLTGTPLPTIFLLSRARFMVKLYGANIYAENVQAFLDQPAIQHCTGRFHMEVEQDEEESSQLVLTVELAPGHRPSAELAADLCRGFVQEVGRLNSEYASIVAALGSLAHPQVRLAVHQDPQHFPSDRVVKTA